MINKITESVVAARCDDLAAQMGWVVERYEQTRATRIKEGLPDRRYVKKGVACVWVELKKPGGKMTENQYHWLLDELSGGGLATVIDDPVTLASVLKEAGNPSSIVRSVLRDRCRALVELCAKRGWRWHETRRGVRAGAKQGRGGRFTTRRRVAVPDEPPSSPQE
jgi:hypothetical protein